MSDDTPATPSAESFDQLKQKHPQASLKAADLPSSYSITDSVPFS